MVQPQWFINHAQPHNVCKLTKAFYGLTRYEELGFQNLVSDSSLFTLKSKTAYALLLVYMDNITIIGNNSQFINDLI